MCRHVASSGKSAAAGSSAAARVRGFGQNVGKNKCHKIEK